MKTKILEIDFEYYCYPEGISCAEDFIAYANEHFNTFIALSHFQTENCVFPYLISEETNSVYLNIAQMRRIAEVEATVLCKLDYDIRLGQIVRKKCIDCVHYTEAMEGDNLNGHRAHLSLDGECWRYEKSSE